MRRGEGGGYRGGRCRWVRRNTPRSTANGHKNVLAEARKRRDFDTYLGKHVNK